MRKLFILPTLIAVSLAISACSYHEGSSYNNHDRKHDNREYPHKDQRPPPIPNNDRDQYNQKDRPNQNNQQQKPTTGKNDKFKRSFQDS